MKTNSSSLWYRWSHTALVIHVMILPPNITYDWLLKEGEHWPQETMITPRASSVHCLAPQLWTDCLACLGHIGRARDLEKRPFRAPSYSLFHGITKRSIILVQVRFFFHSPEFRGLSHESSWTTKEICCACVLPNPGAEKSASGSM